MKATTNFYNDRYHIRSLEKNKKARESRGALTGIQSILNSIYTCGGKKYTNFLV